MRFERVLTMTDFHDGPRGGVAELGGRAHAYTSTFAGDDDPRGGWFELRPVDDATLALAVEDWAIWRRWEEAFHAGLTPIATHPALPAERARHDELAVTLAAAAARREAPGAPVVRARGRFRIAPGHEHAGRGAALEVCWTLADDADGDADDLAAADDA